MDTGLLVAILVVLILLALLAIFAGRQRRSRKLQDTFGPEYDRTVEEAGAPGTLLGIVREPEISEERVALGRGDALLLYTDGVVEASPADEALAPERLAELLRTCEGRDAGAIAEAVERKALAVQDGRLRDDVAVVVLRVEPFAEPGPGVAQPA